MTMADLVALGAPELPEGYFYRITKDEPYELYELEIRKRGTFFSYRIIQEVINGIFTMNSPEVNGDYDKALVLAAKRAYDASRGEYLDLPAENRYVGDHDR